MMRNRFFSSAGVLLIAGLLAATMFLAAAPVGAQAPTTPDGASLVAASTASPEVVYAAGGKAVYRSDDGGRTWTELAGVPSTVTALAPANHNPSLVYVGTQSSGALRSFDGGDTWQTIDEGLGMTPGVALEISALAVDAQNDNIVYAATGYWLGSTAMHFSPVAIVASTSGGSTWLPLAQLPLNSQRIVTLASAPGQPLTVVASDAQGTATTYQADANTLTALVASTEALVAQRAAAAYALGLLGDRSATPTLIVAAQSPDGQLAYRAAEALGALKAEEAVPTLHSILLAEDSPAPAAAANALAAIGTPEAMQALVAALGGDDLTAARHVAMGAFEQLGSQAVPTLVQATAEGSPATQRSAVEMLGWIADPAATPSLVVALQSTDELVRAQASWALGEIGSPAAQEALAAAAANDPSADVRLQATQALARLPEALAAATQPVVAAPATSAQPIVERQQLHTPAWLAANLPILRWLVLAIVLAGAAFLPWYQSVRENRRRRHN